MAAQAGVRYSITNPKIYFKNNLEGFFNILEVSREFKIKHLVYASTSSAYGENTTLPLKENLNCNNPLQFYAATKISNEVMAHSYSKIYGLTITGLRFFTVYGEWGRPDMAFFKFVSNIIKNKPIQVFNNGNHYRDFSYVKNISDGIFKILYNKKFYKKNFSKHNIYNFGNGKKIHLITALKIIENILQKKAKIKYLPLQPGDIKSTLADISMIKKEINFKNNYDLRLGLSNFISWYRKYWNVI